jgi:glycosyltransferase involved in cell wall biosynthesis
MNILQLNKYVTLNGGSESVMRNLHSILTSHRHSVWNMGFHKKHQQMLPNVLDLGPEKLTMKGFFRNSLLVDKVIGKIKALDIDILIGHNIYHHFPVFQLLQRIKQEAGIPILLYLHDYKIVCPCYTLFRDGTQCEQCQNQHYEHCIWHRCKDKSSVKSTLLSLDSFYNYKWKQAYTFCDRFISPSQFLHDKISEMGFSLPVEVLTNPIVDIPSPSRIPELAHRKALYAGRLAEDKGVKILLKMAEQNPDIEFQIAGDGPMRHIVRKAEAQNPNIIYHGHVTKGQLVDLYGRSSFMLVPSIWYENNPMTIIEAMQCRLPVIGQNIGGIPELLSEGCGLLAKDPSVEQWSMTLRKALQMHPEDYKGLQERAHKRISLHSTERYYDRLRKIMESL